MDISHILNGSDEGTWHTFPGCEGKENPAMLRVRPIKPGKQRQLRRQAEKQIVGTALRGLKKRAEETS